jgi:hypothetical protein
MIYNKKLRASYRPSLYSLLIIALNQFYARGQNGNIKIFGHQTFSIEKEESEELFSNYSIGEHDLFVTNNFSKKWSFLGEIIVGPTSTGFKSSIERARVKFAINNKHSVILGKMHTPVNYWNDVYHHGRLFFLPSIGLLPLKLLFQYILLVSGFKAKT